MEDRNILKLFIILLIIGLLTFYWFIPSNFSQTSRPNDSNFTIGGVNTSMQFYDNMRYSSSNITYKIESCPLQKKDAVKRAFQILENRTILRFIEVQNAEDITVTCDGKAQNTPDKNFFIAGEGGPTNITITSGFDVIQHGSVLLLRESQCENPNVAIHEIFHALGFDHSPNPGNIMYEVSSCDQQISNDMIELLNKLYSYPSNPDLSFEEVSTNLKGRFLDTNISLRNNGLRDASDIILELYVNNNLKKTFSIDSLKIGAGKKIIVQNIFISDISFDEMELSIVYGGNELDTTNNELKIKIKE